MSSTVTATSRQYTAANGEWHSIASASQTGLNPGDTNFYIAGWIYADSLGTNIITAKWQSGGSISAYQLAYVSSTLRWIGSSDGTAVSYNINAGALSTATWYFVEAYHDATNNIVGVTYNRAADTTTAYSSGLYASGTAAFGIGAQDSGNAPWNGRLHGFVAISGIPTTAERNALYNAGAGVLYKDRPTLSLATYISWWDGAETSGVLIDALGTNTLTDNNTVTSAAGNITYTAEDASQFTAANSEYLSNANLSFGDTNYSFCGWTYLTDKSGVRNILAKITSTPSLDGEYELYHVAASDRFAFSVYDSADGSDTATANNFGAPAVGTWYFFYIYHDTTNNLIGISINNGTVNTTASTRVTNTSSCNFTIGSIATPTSYYNGRNQFIGAWSRVLTAAEVTSLYNRGFGKDYSDLTAGEKTSMVSYWELTEASGNRADSHGTNTLTDNNSVTGNPGVVYDAAPASSFLPRMMLMGMG